MTLVVWKHHLAGQILSWCLESKLWTILKNGVIYICAFFTNLFFRSTMLQHFFRNIRAVKKFCSKRPEQTRLKHLKMLVCQKKKKIKKKKIKKKKKKIQKKYKKKWKLRTFVGCPWAFGGILYWRFSRIGSSSWI